MNTCGGCGAPLRPGARFCTSCGAAVGPVAEPAPADPTAADPPAADWTVAGPTVVHPSDGPTVRASRRPTGVALPLVLVGALLVAALGVGAAWWLTRPTPAQADPVVTGQASSPFLPPAGSTTPTRPTSTTRPTTTAPPNPGTLLQQQVAADRSAVEAMVGYWVPQISSKTVGTVDNGITYGVPEIWAELQTNKSRYAGTAVLRSEDYSSFDLSGYWVTIVATPYATPAQADAWCTAHNLGPNDCFGKKLTHTGGSAGTTSHR